ncbi:Retinoblastoma-associated protein [Mactra antiquata]
MDCEKTNRTHVESEYEKVCENLAIPDAVKTRGWNVWLDIADKSITDISTSLHEWFCLCIYSAIIDTCMPYGPADPHLYKQSPPCITLTELLQKTKCNVVRFLERSVTLREHTCISEAVKYHLTNIEKRCNVLSPLSIRFNREWSTVFREDERSALPFSDTEGSQYKKELCWLLFLHAKDCLMSENWELANVYHLLLCCLEYILRSTPSFQLLPPYDTLRLKLAENLDQNGYNVALLKKLAENFQADLEELISIQKETDSYFKSLMTTEGDIDLNNLRNSYNEDYRKSGGIDELQYLQQSSILLPDTNKSPRCGSLKNQETPLTPVRAALNTQQQLKRILSASVCEPSPELNQYFENCSNNPQSSIKERLEIMKSRFCSCYIQKVGCMTQKNIAEQRFKQATILYYRVMTALLDMEKERLSLLDFSNLLNNDKFHRSLLACSTEIVLVIFNVLWRPPSSVTPDGDNKFMFPWILQVFDLYAYDFYKVLESFIKAEPNLTREIVQHLTTIENRILDSIAWQPESPVHTAIDAAGTITTNVSSPSKSINNGSASSPAELYLSPVRGQRTQGTSPGKVLFASPRKSTTSGTIIYSRETNTDTHTTTNGITRRSQSLTLFFNKVCRLGYHRMIMLCDLLQVPKDTQQKIWTCFEYCITSRPDMIKNRHLDQILMCSLYGICKVLECEIKFKDIVRGYSTLPHSDTETFRRVFIEGDLFDSIICFYNRVFMQNMKNFILQFARVMQPNLSPVPKPVTPLTASPVYRLAGRQNFFVSPLNESAFKAPHSPSSMTPTSRQLYCFGDLLGSSEKLKSINESLSAFKSRNNLPYITTPKRLDFDQGTEEHNNSSDISMSDDTVPVIVKKRRINPPSPIITRSSSRSTGDIK